MKTINLAAAAMLALGAATFVPAFAADNGTAFDVGSSQYPNVIGRAGSNLVGLGENQVLPTEGNESPIQTANSLPRNFEAGTAEFDQGQSMNRYVVAHNHPTATTIVR